MTAVVGSLSIGIDLDSTKFEQGLSSVREKIQATGRQLQMIGGIMTATVTAPIVGGFGFAVMAASDLNETLNKTSVIFGEAADGVVSWSENSATAFGLSQNEALNLAASFGSIFTSAGQTAEEAAALSQSVVLLGADLGSLNNVGTAETLDAVRAGLIGEYEPLRRFNIFLNDATVTAKALEMGLASTSDELTEQDKILARQALITEQAAYAQGDFANTSGSLANQLKTLKSRLTNAAAAIGQILLPYVVKAVSFISGLIAKFQGLSDTAKRVVVIVGLIVAAIGPLLAGIGTAMVLGGALASNWAKIAKVMKAVRVATMSTLGPLLLVVAVIAALYFIWTKDLFGIRSKITGWFDAFKAGGGIDRLKARFEAFKKVVLDLTNRALAKTVAMFHRVVEAVRGPASQAFDVFKRVLGTVIGFLGTVVSGVVSRLDPLKSAFFGVVLMITSAVEVIRSLFEGDLRGAFDGLVGIVKGWLQYMSGIGEFLLSIMLGVLGYIWTAVQQVDWAGLGLELLHYLGIAVAAIGDLSLTLAGKAGELIGGLWQYLADYNWLQLGLDILGWIGTAVANIGSLVETLKPGAGDMLSGFWQKLSDYNWLQLGLDILGWIGTAITGIGSLLETMAPLAGELLTGFWTAISTYNWSQLGLDILGYIGTSVVAIGSLLETLVPLGVELLSGLKDGAVEGWSSVRSWLEGRKDVILEIAKLIFLPTLLYEYGDDIIDGLWNGAKAVWGLVGGWFAKLGSALVTLGKFIFLPTLLYFYGKDIIDGLWNGAKAVWGLISGWFGTFKTKITDALPDDIASTLWSTGYDILWGALEGMKSFWDNTLWPWVEGLAGDIAGALVDGLKVWSPSRVMRDIGGDIMAGLHLGMAKAAPAAIDVVTNTASRIANVPFTSPSVGFGEGGGIAAGAIVINVTGSGDPVATANEVYGRFARELGLRGAI